ncbi:dehydrogenase [Luteolibacter ambystomatis]|uniref:Dehydrogenase n=2 Tax=Luteolibacter ambystomatis TaxID=2824561 RepID=A0A975J098_9BACT|nr:dehydrogenase [Luteolibacter ambystomatis]
MTFRSHSLLGIALAPSICMVARAQEAPLQLHKGDHIAIVGSGLADRQQHQAWLEALIHRAYPDMDLTIRNLGFNGDEINVHPRSEDVPPTSFFLSMKKGDFTPPDNTKVTYKAGADFGADVIIAYWGFNESFKGEEGLQKFKVALASYLDTQLTANYNGKGHCRVVLVSPIAQEAIVGTDPAKNNRNLALYTQAMAEVAKAAKVPFVNLYDASRDLYAKTKTPLTINGIHLTDEGDKQLAPIQFKALFGREAGPMDDPKLARIRQAVVDKNEQWHHRYRTVDQYNIYGGRSLISYEGITNARILNQEMAQRDVKTANRDQRVWAVAKGGDLVVKDDNLPPVEATPPNRKEPVPYTDPEEAIKYLKLPAGCKVELVASEKTFPDLVNPVQMAFDTKGRLWISAWKNYPETSPTTKEFDKLLVFDLDPKTGKAAKVTTFADGLNCPTGFQFYKDGVLVMQSPDLWYIRDTDGDGKADWKERVLTGLDAADSHHETNSMCLEPGGAVYLSDGVFHRTNVETRDGVVRNQNGCIYRYEPNTGKFIRHAPYGFANPHGRVFDYWGNDLITDATGNVNYFGPAMSGFLDEGAHPQMQPFWDRPSRPCPGTTILSSRHFPDDWQGQFLNTNVISIQGIFRAKITEEGSGIKGETLEHLVSTDIQKNPNFRPSGITVAPDGSLYFMDWSQMLIGHLQHHLRDPNRDHQHGRLYRITYEGRPLLEPKKIDGQPVAALLELLKEPEDNVRQRAKIELGKHDSKQVIAGVKQWIETLDEKDPKFEHNLLEALWVHQWHDTVDLGLLNRVLSSKEPRARAQGVRVLGYWRDRVPNALVLLKKAAADEAPRVRLEAVRVASFFREWEAADIALLALKQPTDYYLDYCLKETMRQLAPWWKQAIMDGKTIASGNPEGSEYIVGSLNGAELAKLPKSTFALNAMLTRPEISSEQRKTALDDLAKLKSQKPVQVLLETLIPMAKTGGKAAEELARLLLSESPADLKSTRAELEQLAGGQSAETLRRFATAALIRVDGSIEPQWNLATKSVGSLVDFLGALQLLPDATLRASAFDKVMPLLGTLPAPIKAALDANGPGAARYVRIELPKGTLTLAEVQVFSGDKNIAGSGSATQSTTAFGGTADHAIDGNTNGDFESGTQSHTEENSKRPWWELDLKTPQAINAVTVWNRTGYEDRLDKFTLTILDAKRKPLFQKNHIPAPKPSLRVAVPLDPMGSIRDSAIEALVSMKKEPGQVFNGLAEMIVRGEEIPMALKGVNRLPRNAWSADKTAKMLDAVTAWAARTEASDRTSPEFISTLKIARDLAGSLSAADAAKVSARLDNLSIRMVVVKTVPEQLRFDVTKLVLEAGKPVSLTLENPDAMPHNIVFVKPGTYKEVAESVQAQPPGKLDSQGRAYVPDKDPRILAATKLIEAGKKETIQFTAPAEEGTYEFVCTFPGHWAVMHGQLIVTKDMAAYLKANPK